MPFTKDLLQYKNEYFVETGTFRGDTIKYAFENGFPHVLSMEMSDVFYSRCVERFQGNPHIQIVHGNSRYDLSKMIEPIHKPITFWLDSHWSMVEHVGFDPECTCPILYELEQIKAHPIKTHTIMVDDIRLMDGQQFYVTKEQIEKKILEINPDYTLRYYDDEVSKNDVLVAFIA